MLTGVVPKWDLGYYDGPLSGIAEYGGRLYYFELLTPQFERGATYFDYMRKCEKLEECEEIREPEEGINDCTFPEHCEWGFVEQPFRYGLFRLTDKEIEYELYWHRMFQTYVGYHTDYGEDGRKTRIVHPQAMHKVYYDLRDRAERRHPKPDDGAMIGWFVWPKKAS